ncbi:MAG: SUMF1/EgtB/PvdO family nonheme iron enzyme [Elusimicrobia bacterium]|nr:SUMF1/EgtB/PvdO family nonheme iron enzyme [Elusimicrobiota bacterium]
MVVVVPTFAVQATQTRSLSAPAPISPIAAPLQLRVGSLLNDYRVDAKIAENGATATTIYKVSNAEGAWALKEMSLEPNLAAAEKTQEQAQFFAEHALLGAVSHPNLAKTRKAFEENGKLYLVREWVEGESLADRLARVGRLSPQQALNLLEPIMGALRAVHGSGFVFRDVKPDNIMLSNGGGAKLIDGGAVRKRGFWSRGDTIALGTPGYAAPEQFGRKANSDRRSDVYGLAATLHHAVTGINPQQSQLWTYAPPHQVDSSIPETFSDALMKALSSDPAARYASMAVFKKALLDSLGLPSGGAAGGFLSGLVAVGNRTGIWTLKTAAPTSRPPSRPTLDGLTAKDALNESIVGVAGRLIEIPAGRFGMGTLDYARDRNDEVYHDVELSHRIVMMAAPATALQMRLWVPSYWPRDFNDKRHSDGDGRLVDGKYMNANHPAVNVSWFEMAKAANSASRADGLKPCYEEDGQGNITGRLTAASPYDCEGWRAPTEAEWERAARAGVGAPDWPYWFGYNDNNELVKYGWYDKNAQDRTHAVGLLLPNPMGFFDMNGLVWEWMGDWYEKDYPTGFVVDPFGPNAGSCRVMRGGSWVNWAVCLRSAYRYGDDPGPRVGGVGFRLARSIP